MFKLGFAATVSLGLMGAVPASALNLKFVSFCRPLRTNFRFRALARYCF